MIKKYIEQSNITILDAIYIRPQKLDNGKWDNGRMMLIYKDLNTNKKHYEIIEDPEIEYYMLKEGEKAAKNSIFIESDKVDKITTKYRNIEKDIAKRTGNEEFYRDNIMSGNRYANKRLHSDCSNVFNSDMNIEDFYRFKFDLLYKNQAFNPTKAYFDIEVDGINQLGDFPQPGECPVNAITYIDSEHMCIFTLLLRNKENPLIQEFENTVNDDLYEELKSFIRERVGGESNEIKYKLKDMRYKMIFYDDEINLINDFFILVNKSKPDFLMAWNMAFDMPYLIQRCYNLGYDPHEIMCHSDFEYKYINYYIDTRAEEITERGDYCKMSSYTVYIDQMIQFASRRKNQKGAFASWKLDYIGDVTTGIRKLDYSHITTNIAKLPYLDYKTFVFYNIMDTIVQYCVENKVNDINYIFNKCLINNTRYEKGHRQTVYLTNRFTKYLRARDLIISNNKNKFNPKPKDKYPGAEVADPKKLNSYSKMKLYGLPIMLFENLDDFDFASMYPSILDQFNIAHNTQVGRIHMPTSLNKNENPFNSEVYCREGAFIEDLQSQNYIEFGQRWFNLAGYKELCEDVDYYFKYIQKPYYDQKFNHMRKPNVLINQCQKIKPVHPLIYQTKMTPLIKHNEMPSSEEIINNIDVSKIVYNE